MSRDTRPRYRQDSSDFGDVFSDPATNDVFRPRGSSLSTQDSFARNGPGLELSGRLNSFNPDTHVEHMRIKMQTRVAVRDKTPHRFQVVPLRDVSKYPVCQTDTSGQLAIPVTPTNHLLRSPSGRLGPYSQTRSLGSSPSMQSPDKAAKEYYDFRESEHDTGNNIALGKTKSLVSNFTLPHSLEHDGTRRKILSDLDPNRQMRKSPIRDSDITRAAHRASHKFATTHSISSRASTRSIQSVSTPTHTPSRSLQVRLHHEKKNSKSHSLNDFESPEFSQKRTAMCEPQTPRQKNSTSKTNLAHHDKAGNRTSMLLDVEENLNLKLKRRNAIYSQSLFIPYLEQSDYNSGHILDVDEPWGVSTTCLESSPSRQFEQHTKHVSFQLDPEDMTYQDGHKFDNSLDDEDTPRRTLQGPAEIKSIGSKDFFTMEQALHCLSFRSPSTVLPIRALKYPRVSRAKPLSGKSDPQSNSVVYPQIILELFFDLDMALEDWSKFP